MTVREMRERMTHKEWVEWTVFLGRRAQRDQLAAARAKWGKR